MSLHDRSISLADGRALRVLDSGGDGPPVVFHHGTPGGAATAAALVARAPGDMRMIAFDRPGYGRSTPRPGRCVGDVAADVEALVDALQVERFATWGWSGGGPHALATAALLPDRVLRCAIWGGVVPYESGESLFLDGMAEANVEEFELTLQGREALEPEVVATTAELIGQDTEGAIAAMAPYCSPQDLAALPRITDVVTDPNRDALGTSHEGWLDDCLVFVAPWGFDPATIRLPVAIWHGAHDLMVPPSHGAWLADRIPGAVLHERPDDGHLTLVETALAETVAFLTGEGP